MIQFVKRNRGALSRGGGCLLLCIILFSAFFIRIQSVPLIPDGQFTGSDPYFYYRNAQLISEHGLLPARDMDRWLPLGRDLEQTLPIYSYAVAYSHKVAVLCFPNLSLYQLTLYAPTICFVVGLGVLFIFLWRAFGILFATLTGVLLTILPSAIDRSVTGFSDRDSWCLMLGILAVTTYLTALQARHHRARFLWTITSGFTMFLGGMSWEGFGVFSTVILVVELWRMLTSEMEDGLGLYLLWVCTFVPTLYLISPAYHNGQWFATHLRDFLLIPPLVLLGVRGLRYFLLTKAPLSAKLQPHSRALTFGLTMAVITGAVLYVLNLFDTFDNTTVSLSQTRLMQTVRELNDPDYKYWVSRYGSVFILGSIGTFIASVRLWKELGIILAISLGLFSLIAFFGDLLKRAWGIPPVNTLLFLTLAGVAIGLFLIARQRHEVPKNELTYVVFITWFIFWLVLSRDAVRYDFFVMIPIAFFATELIHFLSNTMSLKLRHSKYTTDAFRKDIKHIPLRTVAAILLLSLIMFWTPAGALAIRAFPTAKHIRNPYPGRSHTNEVFRWMNEHLPNTAVVAANWESGNLLNVLAGVKTITDADHFLPHWITLYYRYVHCTDTVREALEFLKTHNATHLMLTERDLQYSGTYAFIGGYIDKNAKQFKPRQLQITTKYIGSPQRLTGLKHTPFASLTFDEAEPNILTARLRTGKLVKLPAVIFIDTQHQKTVPENIQMPYGGAVLYFDKHQQLEKAYYLSTVCWNSLAARLFFRGEMPNVFVPIYPTSGDAAAEVKVWEIHYPSDIKPNPEYLATEPEE
ncbi:MAG: hypothetical protein OXU51_02615 [Candidatus Poribacteria bacterium]|nr:hypothetical protein [Candidatus Poribacteria bacterium]